VVQLQDSRGHSARTKLSLSKWTSLLSDAAYRDAASILDDLCRTSACPIYFESSNTSLDETLAKMRASPDVPPVIWAFWFSKDMAGPRREGAKVMPSRFGVPLILLNSETIKPFLQWPVPRALKFASKNHISDFFRIYFLFHYGGGYADVKPYLASTKPWTQFFQVLATSIEADVMGAPEIGPHGVGSPPGKSLGQFHYRLISNTFLMAKRNNPYLAEVHRRQLEIFEKKAKDLELHPAPFDRCCFNHEGGYPLRWVEVMGEIMAEVGVTVEPWEKRILRILPFPKWGAY